MFCTRRHDGAALFQVEQMLLQQMQSKIMPRIRCLRQNAEAVLPVLLIFRHHLSTHMPCTGPSAWQTVKLQLQVQMGG